MFKLNFSTTTTYVFFKINYNKLLLINLKSFNYVNFFFYTYYYWHNYNYSHVISSNYKKIWNKTSQISSVFDTNLFKYFPQTLHQILDYYLPKSRISFNFNLAIIKNNKNYFYYFFKLNINLFKFYFINNLILFFFKNISNNFILSYYSIFSKKTSLSYFNIFSESKNILMINNFLI